MAKAEWVEHGQTRKLGSLKPHPKNSRLHSEAQVQEIAASMAEFDWTIPILIDEADVILAGHARQRAGLPLKGEDFDAPVIVAHGWSEAKKRAYVIADNRLTEKGEWDQPLLLAELTELRADFPHMDFMGFTDLDFAALQPAPAGHSDPDAVPKVRTAQVSALGDVWLLGDHRIICGDSTDPASIGVLMQGRRADLLFTSPPYGQQRDYGTGKVTDWDKLMRGVFSAAPMADDGQMLVNLGLVHQEGEWLPYWDGWIEWMRAQGWRRFGFYVWDQGPGLPGEWSGRLAPAHEFIFHFNRQKPSTRKSVPSKMAGVVSNGGLRKVSGMTETRHGGPTRIQSSKVHDSVYRVMRHKGGLGKAGDHPAVFPVALAEEIHAAHSDALAIVYEPFGGSGSQIIAAERSGRICYASEIDPLYVDVAVRRWQLFTGKAATHEGSGLAFDQMVVERTRSKRRSSRPSSA